jgi:hypothetical protein
MAEIAARSERTMSDKMPVTISWVRGDRTLPTIEVVDRGNGDILLMTDDAQIFVHKSQLGKLWKILEVQWTENLKKTETGY